MVEWRNVRLKNICILGATGSIGSQTIDVIRKEREHFSLIAVSAYKNYEKIIEIIKEFKPKYAAMIDQKAYEALYDYCKINNEETKVLFGIDGLNEISSIPEVNIVVTSVVGMVGLIPTLTAIKSGKDIALANKETLVVGGKLVTEEAKRNNVHILPVDSEHGAIFQCLQGNSIKDIDRIILTASGGPFRGRKREELKYVTVNETLSHPTWNMGRKISTDSATLMNKGLEVIEAHWLFNTDFDKIDVLIHPQSTIHSMVEYTDGSIIAQLSSTDMRLPIQYALNYPIRSKNIIEKLDFLKIKALTFEEPDIQTFKPLKLAYEAGRKGGTYPAMLNGANEACVGLFLEQKIKFLDIGDMLESCMNHLTGTDEITIESIFNADKEARDFIMHSYSTKI